MKDVDIFAGCLKDLLLENDVVTVPGLGSFMTRLMPASFSDLGRTINPPYRKLSFRAAEMGDPKPFIDYLTTLLPEGQDVGEWLQTFVAGFKEELDKTKRVDLAALGAMRATEQNDYFFVASEDLDIYPEGMGLEPVTIKTSTLIEPEPIFELESEPAEEPETEVAQPAEPETEVTEEPSPAAPEEDVAIELESEPEQPAETAETPEATETPATVAPAAEVPAAAAPSAPVQEKPASKPRRCIKWWAVVLIVLAVLLIFLILSVIFKDQLPWGEAVDNIINHLLYSEEELRILNS